MGAPRLRRALLKWKVRAADDCWPRKTSIKNITAEDHFLAAA